MAAAAAGIFNQQLTAGQALTGQAVTPMDSPTSGTSSSSGSSADSSTISANDFLTLLVTEMQNQDPTADTDPMEYINQLVQVNSLEQLIDINQTLTTDSETPAPSTPSGSGSNPAPVAKPALAGASPAGTAVQAASGALGTNALAAARPAVTGGTGETQSAAFQRVFGNLGVPDASPAAERVAHALDGRTRALPAPGSVTASQ